jgi:hypothetical protein
MTISPSADLAQLLELGWWWDGVLLTSPFGASINRPTVDEILKLRGHMSVAAVLAERSTSAFCDDIAQDGRDLEQILRADIDRAKKQVRHDRPGNPAARPNTSHELLKAIERLHWFLVAGITPIVRRVKP